MGSGTTLLAAEQVGVQGIGFESHPLISKIALAKLSWRTDIDTFKRFSLFILSEAKKITSSTLDYPNIVYKCYDDSNLLKLDALKKALFKYKSNSDEYELAWTAFVSILRCSSHAGTAPVSYTHLDVYKRQIYTCFLQEKWFC